jgi:hypothetical protein
MRLLDWWKRRSRDSRNPRLDEWREKWAAAAAQPSAEQLGTLTSDLEELGLDEDQIEIEREMLEALARLVALAASVAEQGLPALETGHRIAGSDACHFTAPASMPDEAAQPSGRLLLTSTRAAFAGGGASRTIAWHTVAEAVPQDRDLLLIRTDRQTGHRFRCNSYGDAVCAAFIARRLIAVRSARAPRV